MAPNFLALATTLENLRARWLLAKKVNFVPCICNVYARIADCKLHSPVIPLRQITEVNSSLYTRPKIKILYSNN